MTIEKMMQDLHALAQQNKSQTPSQTRRKVKKS